MTRGPGQPDNKGGDHVGLIGRERVRVSSLAPAAMPEYVPTPAEKAYADNHPMPECGHPRCRQSSDISLDGGKSGWCWTHMSTT